MEAAMHTGRSCVMFEVDGLYNPCSSMSKIDIIGLHLKILIFLLSYSVCRCKDTNGKCLQVPCQQRRRSATVSFVSVSCVVDTY